MVSSGAPDHRCEPGTKRVAPLSHRKSSTIRMNPSSGQSAESRRTSTCSSWAGDVRAHRSRVQRTELERSTDDAAARIEQRGIYVEVVELRTTIHEVAHARRGAADPDIVTRRGRDGGGVRVFQRSHPIERHRAVNHHEASIMQLRGCVDRELTASGQHAKPVVDGHRNRLSVDAGSGRFSGTAFSTMSSSRPVFTLCRLRRQNQPSGDAGQVACRTRPPARRSARPSARPATPASETTGAARRAAASAPA